MQHTGTVPIATRRLTLRRYAPSDAEALFENLLSDPHVMAHVDWDAGDSPKDAEVLVGEWVRRYANPAIYRWAIVYQGELVGDIAVTRWNRDDANCALGFCLARKLWGQGLMPEALVAVMKHLFYTVGFHRVGLMHTGRNPASGRAMAKAGLLYEGRMQGAARHGDGFDDLLLYGATRDTWQPTEP